MKEIVVILGQNVLIEEYDFTNKYIIGADFGALFAIQNNLKLDVAIGDFDSITPNELTLVKKNSKKIIQLNPIKDKTDSNEAIEYAYSLGENVTILGGIQGNRIEHFLANVFLFKKYPKLVMIDHNSRIEIVTSPTKIFKNDYKYISFFALEEVVDLTLKGFKYPLTNYNLKIFDPLCISNELITTGEIIFTQGMLLMISTKQDKIF